MSIVILDATKFNSKLKVTIQVTGKLGFTEETARTLALSTESYVRFAQDSESGLMYLTVLPSASESGFKVCSAGQYYYLPTTSMFRTLGYKFDVNNIIFDLVRVVELDEQLGGISYKMLKRENARTKRKEETEM